MAFGDFPGRQTVTTIARQRKAATAGRATSGVSAATRARVSSLFAEAKKLYAPEGEFMAGTEATIARGAKRSVASGVQQLASAGLAGTSIVGGLGKKYEEEVGMPARARATTARLGALAGLLQAEAGVTASLATRYSTSPVSRGGGGGAAPRVSVRRAPRTTAQPRATTQPQPLPPFSQPTLRTPKREPTGYRGIYFGADFYKRQQQQAAAPTVSGGDLMRQADVYDISGRYF